VGALFIMVGAAFGLSQWIQGIGTGRPATSGTVMLAALPVLIGIQFLIAFLHFDVSNVPTEPLSISLNESID